MLWLISCTKSTDRNIFTPEISKGLSWRQNVSISIFTPKKWWKRLSEISKGNQEIQGPLMGQDFMLTKFLGKSGSCWDDKFNVSV